MEAETNIKQILARYFAGRATVEEEKAIREWLAASPDNHSVYMRERKLFDISLLYGNVKEKPAANHASLWIRETMKIAAVAVIVLLGSYFYQEYKAAHVADIFQTIYVPAGQRINMTLADGTNVWLNARTTLRYPINFNSKERHVILDGEAYFKVSKDEKRRFVVETDQYNINVLGTEFNVDAYSTMQNFDAMLVRGKVNVSSRNDINTTYDIQPGQRIQLRDGKATITNVDDYNIYRWREGLICFRDESVSSIMKEFEKYYDIKIVVENNKINDHLYTGKFRQADGVEYALRVLLREEQFKYERDEERNIIYIK